MKLDCSISRLFSLEDLRLSKSRLVPPSPLFTAATATRCTVSEVSHKSVNNHVYNYLAGMARGEHLRLSGGHSARLHIRRRAPRIASQ